MVHRSYLPEDSKSTAGHACAVSGISIDAHEGSLADEIVQGLLMSQGPRPNSLQKKRRPAVSPAAGPVTFLRLFGQVMDPNILDQAMQESAWLKVPVGASCGPTLQGRKSLRRRRS